MSSSARDVGTLFVVGAIAGVLLAGCAGAGTTRAADAGASSGGWGQSSGSGGQNGTGNASNHGGSGGGGGVSGDGSGTGGASVAPGGLTGLGAHPADGGVATVGGTMTFTNVGAAGWWPRRLDRDPSDAACTFKSGTDTWGGPCCLTEHSTASTELSPFDEEMTLLLKAVKIRQLAVYQPASAEPGVGWNLVSAWDDRDGVSENLWATQAGDGSTTFPDDAIHDDCVWYVSQTPTFDCGDGQDYYCPDDPGIKHLGWSGSKLVVLLASMTFDDAGVTSCGGTGVGSPAPWIAFVSSELTRDGGRKYNGLCNCYSKTGTVGDGCGEINLFEVVMDNNAYSNREFISTGVRSFQAGHVGGNVCGSDCLRSQFPADQDVVDACAKAGYGTGPTLAVGGATTGCPVWVRPVGDRYLLALLDRDRRVIQVAMIHPGAIPSAAAQLLPDLPGSLTRSTVDALVDLRLP